MKDVFLRLVTLSLTCSAVLLPLLILGKRLRGRYAAKTLYFLWLLLALRMVLPLPLGLPQAPVTVELPAYEVTVPAKPPAAPAAPVAPWNPGAYEPETTRPEAAVTVTQSVDLMDLAAAVWQAGIALFLVWQIVGYLLARRRFSRGVRWEVEYIDGVAVYRSLRVCTPVAMGLFRPIIFLPAQGMDEESEAVALSHELCHIGRHDLWYKALFLLVNAVHWFNPLAWLMAREAGRNVELCCDDDVLRHADGPARKHYGRVLLSTAAGSTYPAFSTHFGSGKKQLKERLTNLFQPKKSSALLVCVILAAALLAGGLVACESGEEKTGQTGILYDKPISAQASADTTEFTTALGAGDVLSVRFENKASSPCKVTLYRYGLLGAKDAVLTVEVAPGETEEGRYTGGNDSATYYANLSALDGGVVDGILTVSQRTANGAVYATFDFMRQAEGTDYEIVKLAVVDYDPETDTVGQVSEEQSFIMAEDVLLRREESGNALSPGKKGTEERKRELMNFFFWPTLRATAYPGEGDLIELVLNEAGEVAQMTWRRTKVAEDPAETSPQPTQSNEPAVDRRDLDACVGDAILTVNAEKSLRAEGDFATQSHVTLKTVEGGDTVTVYAMALYAVMIEEDGGVAMLSGSHVPVAITFRKDSSGAYTLEEYWEAPDGGGYDAVLERFPDGVTAEEVNTQRYGLAQIQSCYAQAVVHFGIGIDEKMAALLDVIASSPATSSNPGDYIKAHSLDYRELTYYGNYALDYCFARFEEGGQTDLRGHIIAILCRELLGIEDGGGYATGQAWYDAYISQTALLWPVEGEYRINNHFWLGEHYLTGVPGDHTGCDISAPAGTLVRVAAGGTVTEVSHNSVFVAHNDRLQTRYAGLKDIAVTVGETVERGMLLGVVWDTVEKPAGQEPFHGTTSLHYEYLVDGQWVNPLDNEYFNYVKADGTALGRGDLNAPQW